MRAVLPRVPVVAHDRALPMRLPVRASLDMGPPSSSGEVPLPVDATAPPMPTMPMVEPPTRAPAVFRPHNQRRSYA